jgi:hypothetical protein
LSRVRFSKAHRRPKRMKGIKNLKKVRVATAPGQVVSVDQLVSPTMGFVPTHCGIPITKRYTGATIFVDHFSDFTYTHLIVGHKWSPIPFRYSFNHCLHCFSDVFIQFVKFMRCSIFHCIFRPLIDVMLFTVGINMSNIGGAILVVARVERSRLRGGEFRWEAAEE